MRQIKMKKKLCILFISGFFSIALVAQQGDKKIERITPASQVILKSSGEKKLPRTLKEKQLSASPETLIAYPQTTSPDPSTKHGSKKYKHKN